jgi:hypothetical protein
MKKIQLKPFDSDDERHIQNRKYQNFVTDVQNFFSIELLIKYTTKQLLHFTTNPERVATVTCEIINCANDVIFYRRSTTIFTVNNKTKQFYFVCYWWKQKRVPWKPIR